MKVKRLGIASALATLLCASSGAQPVILDETGVQNLRIETVEADYRDFSETLFAIGRIEPVPARKSVLSSRIPGHINKIFAHEGDLVEEGEALVQIVSLQPGNPPPTLSLEAPQKGMVMKSHTHLGKPVEPNVELFEIIDLSKVYAVARLPEDQAGKLHIGSRATIRVAALPNERFEGELTRFGTEANPESGTIDAHFVIENPQLRVRPSMRAEFSIVLDTKSQTLSVPKNAIQSDGINRFVFVEHFDLPNAFVKAPVQIGSQSETRVEIVSGLFPGDRVVTRGSYALMFAGGSSISLKEALDAAHGHEHNEDGSELTAAQRQAKAKAQAPDSEANHGPLVLFLSILCALLLGLLGLSAFKLKSRG